VTTRTQALRAIEPRAILAGAVLVTVAVLAGVLVRPESLLMGVAGLVLAIGGVMAVLLQVDRPALGLLFLLVTSVMLPLEFAGPSASRVSTSFPIAAALCGVWLARIVALPGRTRMERSRLTGSLATLMAVAVAAFLYGLVPMFPSGGAPLPAQIAQLLLFLVSGGLLLVAAHQITSEAQVRWMSWVFVGTGTVAALTLVISALGSIANYTTRPQSIGSLFWTWLLAMSLSQALLNRDLSSPTRIILLGIAGLVLFHGLVQVRSWASGWLPPLMALGVIALVRFPRTAVAGGLVGVPVLITGFQYLSAGVMNEAPYSLLSREQAWVTLWRLVERSPIVGTGLANYYYYTENFPLLGWYVRFIAHNNYQDMLVQTGFVGVTAFAWFSFELIAMLLSLIPRVPAGFAYAYVVGALGATVGSLGAGMLGDWIIPFYYNAGILGFRSSLLMWVFLGGALALKRMTRTVVEAEVPASDPVVARRRGNFRRVPQPDWV
jgi:hypothetical protein